MLGENTIEKLWMREDKNFVFQCLGRKLKLGIAVDQVDY